MASESIEYTPLDKQQQFHDSRAKLRLYLGAWRAGKTFSGCAEAWRHLYHYPGNEGLIGRKDYADLIDTTYKTFRYFVPEGCEVSERKSPSHSLVIPSIDPQRPSTLHFRGLKDGAGLGSLNLGFFYVDEAEEVQESIFQRLIGRLSNTASRRQCGWCTSNPPNKNHWLHETFVEAGKADYDIIYASTYENEANLPPGYIESLEDMPASWQRKYLKGEFGFTPSGAPVYPDYREEMHRSKEPLPVFKGRDIFAGWDFGYHSPAVLFTQLDNKGRWLWLRELMGKDQTIDQFGDLVVSRIRTWFPPDVAIRHYGDPAGNQRTDKAERTSIQILASKGINVKTKVSSIREGLELVGMKLSKLVEGLPSLLLDPSCTIMHEALSGGYHYPESMGDKPVDENPVKDGYYDHGCDCARYIAINIFDLPIPKVDRKAEARYRREEEEIEETYRRRARDPFMS